MPDTSLGKEISKLVRHIQGTVGLAIKHVQSGESLFLNEDQLFPTASVFKVSVLVELFNQAQERKIYLTQKLKMKERDKSPGSGVLKELHTGLELTVKDLATLMIIISDNTATDILTDLLGLENIDTTMHRLGYKETKVIMNCKGILFNLVDINPQTASKKQVQRGWELLRQGKINLKARALSIKNNNVSTPYEMTCLFEDVLTHKTLDRSVCDGILDILKRQ